ncbi:MAG TPA: glycosyltransferase [Pyrinomonadaceae bacterium]|nr:glycosyltransferase [Pyrinomonadaceae bacterium]
MSEYPFFSVVIPTYNRAAFIEATLQSVLNQTYPHYEIIVVDNCSTDNTEELLQPYISAGQIYFIKHEQNFERARSRNTGMSVARGDFVTLLDSDDFMYPTNLADAAEYARANPEIKCFHNLYEFVDSERNTLRRQPLPPLKNQLKAIAGGNFMTCIGDFIHREIYEQYKFDVTPELTGGEDWEFWLRVLADYRVGRIEKINSGILQHEGRSVNNQSLESMKRGLDHLCAKLETEPHLAEVYRPYLERIRANSLLYLAILANTSGRFVEAREFLKRAVKSDFSLLVDTRLWRVARRAFLKLQPL